ncbi:ArsR/SmtB family transcription factor [Paenibacillus sp. B1-33]|uniref:ArsR/SmtB family transcription factor n=1 Tax=unclassified Paenibacillus TaxID=185978 RepID=UPI003D2BA13F
MLAQGDRTQSDFVQFFHISQPAVKKHLQILLEEGVISEQKQGKYRIYRLEQALLQSEYQSLLFLRYGVHIRRSLNSTQNII